MGRVNAFGLRQNFTAVALLLASLALGLVSSARGATTPSRWATLEAIHQLENPRNLSTPGPFGELGAYQFREMTWRMHSNSPFVQALDRRASDEVAVKHYEWLKRRLEGAGLPATCYNIALAWNGGLEATVLGRAPAVAHDYADRATNLARALSARVVASVR